MSRRAARPREGSPRGSRAKQTLAALLLGLAAAAASSEEPVRAPDVPAGPARIAGRVLRAEDGSPVAGAEVALYALTSEGVPGLRRTESDAEGRFAFENVANDPAIGWLVGARFGGVAFPGGRVTFAPGAREASVEVTVDQPSADPRRVEISEQRLRLVREPAGLRAIETLVLENRGRHTYYAAPEAHGEAAPALVTSLPAGATRFEMPLGVVPEGLVREGRRLAWYGPVYPGTQELSWSYVLPAPAAGAAEAPPTRFAFEAHVPERTQQLVVLADSNATLEGPGLAGPEETDIEGRKLRRFTRAKPPAGALALAVTLPAARVAPEAVSLSEVRAVLRLDDAALEVTETHTLRVAGESHVLGTPEAPLLHIPLPAGAARLRFGSDAPGLELAPHAAGGLAVVGSVAPGASNVELAYQLAQGDAPTRFERRFAARVPVLSVFVADTGRLAPRSDRLHRRRPLRTPDLTYLHLEAFEVAKDEPVAVELGQLPAPGRGGRPLALGALALVVVGAGWFLTRPLRGTRGRELAQEAEESAARREREALYEAIRDLDHDFETGKLSEGDHARLRDEFRARALALLEEERVQAAASHAASPAQPGAQRGPASPGLAGGERSQCPACGAPALPAHRFCPQCGEPLGSDGAARGETPRAQGSREPSKAFGA